MGYVLFHGGQAQGTAPTVILSCVGTVPRACPYIRTERVGYVLFHGGQAQGTAPTVILSCVGTGRGQAPSSCILLFSHKLLADGNDLAAQVGVGMQCAINFFAGVENGTMVASPKKLSDFK